MHLMISFVFQGTFNNKSGGNGTTYHSNGLNISAPITPHLSVGSVHRLHGPGGGSGSTWSLAVSPPPSEEARYSMVKPKNLVERARLNVG